MKKISFILPVYNVEAYLPQCLDSILDQMTDACEMILVDDGATDSSGAICDRYAQQFGNVTVLHKPNGGLSSARNAGMAAAEGEYVCFVDSDDYIAEGAVQALLDWIDENKADVCFLKVDKVYPDGKTEPMADGVSRCGIHGKSRDQVLDFLAGCAKFPGSAWAKLLRREFLVNNNIHFPDDRRLSEDLLYCVNVFQRAESFDVLEHPFYFYRQNRAGSITNNINARYYFDTALFVEEVAGTHSGGKAADSAAACALSFAAYEYAILLWQQIYLQGEDRKRALKFLREYRWVLKHGKSPKTKLVNAVVSACGVSFSARILNIYMSNRG